MKTGDLRPFNPLATLALAGAILSCGPAPEQIEHVLLITLDTTRADALDCRAEWPQTPNLCALAAEGVSFERAYTTSPLTLPAHASLFTGLVPPRHRVRENGMQPLAREADTLAERFGSAGYETAAFVSAAVLDSFFGLDQGFERYDQPSANQRVEESEYLERDAERTLSAVRDWLDARDASRPFFLWIHLFDPHVPYVSHAGMGTDDPYLGEVIWMDRAVGAFLDELRTRGLFDETLVCVVGDHGESRFEHGEPTHGALCYEAAVRIPLILRMPGGPPREHTPPWTASIVDLYPTLLAAANLEVPLGLDGYDLFGGQAPAERGVYLESYSGFLHYGWSPLAGWVDLGGKYLHSSTPEYYAVRSDPAEERNLYTAGSAEVLRARAAIGALVERPGLPLESADGPDFSAALRALGYAHSELDPDDFPSPLAASDRPSPADRKVELTPLLRAHALVQAGRPQEALSDLEAILASNPGHLLALDLQSTALMLIGRYADAVRVLRERLRRGPERAYTLHNLALCLEAEGELAAALAELESALVLDPTDVASLTDAARIAEALGREERARLWREQAAALEAEDD